MQCGRCGFENLPGFTACARCGSVLAATAGLNVHPPRARGAVPLRGAAYGIRRHWNAAADAYGQWTAALDEKLLHKLGGLRDSLWMLVEFVPGLGHLLSGRIRSIRIAWPAWLLLLMIGGALWGTQWGSVVLGMAFSAHAWMMLKAGRVRPTFDTGFGRYIGILLLLVAVGVGVYGALPRFWVRGVHVTSMLAEEGVKEGDFVLVWKKAYAMEPMQRGDIVLYRTYKGMDIRSKTLGGYVLGKVFGLPGESVSIDGGIMTIEGRSKEMGRYEIPPGYAPGSVKFTVPEDNLFCFPAKLSVDSLGVDYTKWELGLMMMAAVAKGSQNPFDDVMSGSEGMDTEAKNLEVIEHVGFPRTASIIGRAGFVYNTWWDRRPIPRVPLKEIGTDVAPKVGS